MKKTTAAENHKAVLRQIAGLWPRQTTARIMDVNGINDGKDRAILLLGAVNLARRAVGEPEAA